MKIKKVNQYACDFCGKKKYSASAMTKHEKHCTMNPNRECRFCIIDQGASTNNIPSLVARLPKDVIVVSEEFFPIEKVNNEVEILAEFEKIKKEVNECPACLLAVIRQSKSIVNFPFYYKNEAEQFWKDRKEEDISCYY